MAFKKVVVTLHSIFNENTGPDPGDALEVFGRFDVGRLAFDPVNQRPSNWRGASI